MPVTFALPFSMESFLNEAIKRFQEGVISDLGNARFLVVFMPGIQYSHVYNKEKI